MIWFDDGDRLRFDAERCCLCGGCLAACDAGALGRRPAADGRFEIVWDDDACVRCGRCVEVCPAPELPRRALTAEALAEIRVAYVGRAADPAVRRSSSSGGVARTLVTAALETGTADLACCLVSAEQPPWARGALLGKGFDPSVIANSVYRPVPLLEECGQVGAGSTLVVTGTHCQLLAAEHLYGDAGVDLLRIGLLCKQQKHLGFTRFVRRRLGMDAREERRIDYRGDGWPGRISAGGRSIGFSETAALPFGKWLWTIPACMYCANAFGDTADLTIADPWGIVRPEDAGDGMSMIAVRTEKGAALLAAAGEAIELEQIDTAAFARSIRWPDLERKIASIPIRLGESGSRGERRRLDARNRERRWYEWILERFDPPRVIRKILGRLPFAGLPK
ncbi:MAG: Coenzyme F420 hydrogenase/dehydrogenase, beta subunit C-terminal domain [Candidatus Krumholzibacteriota bacterium]|nr:Coenzyme F420 hydrogenase/dehydrogenase, beta subunit C-terminal domain [Candidatus Krumholzibacteriota bacterium]